MGVMGRVRTTHAILGIVVLNMVALVYYTTLIDLTHENAAKDECPFIPSETHAALSRLVCPDGICKKNTLSSLGLVANSSSIQHHYLFVHVPKTAGSSVREFFKGVCRARNISLLVTLNARFRAQVPFIMSRKRPRFQALFGHFAYGIHQNFFSATTYSYFGTFRSPVERWMSHFSWSKQKHFDYVRNVPIGEWVNKKYDCNLQFAIYSGLAPNDFSLQDRIHHSWPIPCDNYDSHHYDLVERVKRTLRDDFEFIVLQSRFTESLIIVCDIMSIPDAVCEKIILGNQKQIHRSASKNYMALLTKVQLKKIEMQNHLDELLHQYVIQLFNTKWEEYLQRRPSSPLLRLVTPLTEQDL